MKGAIRLALGLVLLSALAAWAVQSGATKMKGDRIQIGGAESMRALTFPIDSLGANASNRVIFKTPRGMLVFGGTIQCGTKFIAAGTGQVALVTLKCGSTTSGIKVDSADVYQDSMWATALHFDSAASCTVLVDDGSGDGTGGANSSVTFWYNDDYNGK
jgi:hypothetical protein